MSKALHMSAAKREIVGKKVSQLRKAGFVVGNIFSKGKESTAIQVEYEVMRKMVDKAGFNHPILLQVEGADEHLVLIKSIERDPRKHMIEHVGFHEVRKDQKVEAEVPVELIGTSPAVLAGNIVLTVDNTIMVSANPMSLPDHLEVSAELLANPDDMIQAKDLVMPAGVELVDEPEKVVYRVDVPRSQVETDDESTEADAVAATLEASGGKTDEKAE
jgi:large subunit ribosomal protein L25